MSETTTETSGASIRIRAFPTYHAERSQPARSHWFFSYRIEITNVGSRPVQLLARHWRITDATGRVEDVRGPGVIGETPRIAPGATFAYTSFCPLPTPLGAMEGSYTMQCDDGTRFEARIDPFVLEDPASVN